MTTNEKTLGLFAIGLMLVIGFAFVQYTNARRDLEVADAVAKVKDAEIAKADAVITDAQKRLDARDAASAQQQKQFAAQRAAIATEAQAVAAIKKNVPGSGAVQISREQLPAAVQQQLPDAAGYTVVTQDTTVKLAQMTVDVERLTAEVESLSADNTDLRLQLAAEKGARQDEHDKAAAYKKAAKGTWIRRLGSAAKWTGAVIAVAVIEKIVLKK